VSNGAVVLSHGESKQRRYIRHSVHVTLLLTLSTAPSGNQRNAPRRFRGGGGANQRSLNCTGGQLPSMTPT